ncbi:sigma-54-dependent Fis family transcriptional regulator [Nitrogeniibacter mangrovi]|uniref:Sigma-54-dependent Fis family transcriptional regulator n=1 Tax=Nitrogeniibacter mangrovi TaxID=2016596 RepID=A0A6C1B7A2_9RHOO|nr:response regulator [Nitrogeniibacter mangrovi]QID19646.1 sigma-54-dependent Fis family transcriptional regulator [Nitrogeniibacter mangrovi]
MPSILIVDDEVGIRELLSEILSDEGYDIVVAENAATARAQRHKARPDLVLLDIWMPDSDGISLLKEWAAAGQLNMPVIMMSGHGTIDTAVEATRIGAIDYLEKPIALQKLLGTVKRALEQRAAQESPRISPLTLAAFPRSSTLKELGKRLGQISLRSRHVLFRLHGGSLAELAARSLPTRRNQWLDLGAVSGPIDVDLLQGTQGGILYVEELNRLSRPQQKNLAFALDRLERYDLHLAAATDADADALVDAGWDAVIVKRLFEVSLALPALEEIRDDIPDLASQLLVHLIECGEAPHRKFSTAALNALRTQGWNSGYTQLRAAVRSLALGTLEEEIGGEDVQRLISPAPATHGLPLDLPLREAREAFERVYFEHHLMLEGGNMTRLAEKTGLERTHLYRKLKQLGISSGRRGEDRSG